VIRRTPQQAYGPCTLNGRALARRPAAIYGTERLAAFETAVAALVGKKNHNPLPAFRHFDLQIL
jgi:hypothetical protein